MIVIWGVMTKLNNGLTEDVLLVANIGLLSGQVIPRLIIDVEDDSKIPEIKQQILNNQAIVEALRKVLNNGKFYYDLKLENEKYCKIIYKLNEFWSGTPDYSFRCLFEELMGGSEKLEKLLENTEHSEGLP